MTTLPIRLPDDMAERLKNIAKVVLGNSFSLPNALASGDGK
ncbi:MAG: hypothetical protein ACXV8Q_05165 [Methylobacter sp.]